MPKRISGPCRQPGCPARAVECGYCAKHARAVRAATDERRGSSAQRGYGARWQRLRVMFLAQHPLCADPFFIHSGPVAASDVDHIVPRRDGGTDDWSNLQALCHSCHSRKTAAGG